MEKLPNLGLKTIMLIGDRSETEEAIGKKIGLQEVRTGLKSEDKVAVIKNLA